MGFERNSEFDKVLAVRKLGDFLEARVFKAGFRTLDEFIAKTGHAKTTIYAILALDGEPKSSHRGTLENVAVALKFNEWAEVVRAWKSDNVMAGLGAEGSDDLIEPKNEPAAETSIAADGDASSAPKRQAKMTYNPTPGEAVVVENFDTLELVKLAKRAVKVLLDRQKEHPTMMGAKDQLEKIDGFLKAMRDDLLRRRAKHA